MPTVTAQVQSSLPPDQALAVLTEALRVSD